MATRYLDRDVLQHLSSLVNRNAIENYSADRRSDFLDLVVRGADRVVVTGNVLSELRELPARHSGLRNWVEEAIRTGKIEVGATFDLSGKNAGERSILKAIQASFASDDLSLLFDKVTVYSNDNFWALPENLDSRIDTVNSTLGVLQEFFVAGDLSVEEFVQAVQGLSNLGMLETGVFQSGSVTLGNRFGVEPMTVTYDEALGLYVVTYGNHVVTMRGDSKVAFGFRDECFLAGTPISMADGSAKPIEQVRPDDWVMSFDPMTGEAKPGRVKRTMRNRAKIVLDFHGTFVTPGHVYFCAGGRFEGRFAPLIDILRDDGVIQQEGGTLIRATTGCEVGSPDDLQFWAFLTREDPDGDRVIDRRRLRFGTRWMLPDGNHFSMREYMEGIGIEPMADGYMRWKANGLIVPFIWTLSESLPNPEDFVLARSRTTLEEIYRVGEWEGRPPAMPAPMVRDGGPVQVLSATGLAAVKRNVPVSMTGGPASSVLLPDRPLNRHLRKAEEARHRRAAKHSARQMH